jgi:hypothetical protein
VTAAASDYVVRALGGSQQIVSGSTREPIGSGAATEFVAPWAADQAILP